MPEVMRALLARVKTDKGLHVVHRGEEVPDNAVEGEVERLQSISTPDGEPVLGEPFKTPDEVAVDEAELLRSNFETEVEEAQAVTAAPVTSASSPEEIEAFVADATATQIVDAAADANDPDLDAALVAAEQDLRGDDARKSVVALTDEG